MKNLLLVSLLVPLLSAAPKLGPRQRLFNGKNLDGFYTFLRGETRGSDSGKVFTVVDGQIRASGEKYGYICTNAEYENYYLLIEFRWGDKTWPPRLKNARDSGVLFHVAGEDKVWPASIEFQMIEGGTGDIILVGGTALTVKGERRDKGRFDRFEKGAWKDEIDYRDPGREVEKPRGQWNRLELWAEGDRVTYKVNGVLVNEGSGASVRKGKILLQSEGAEVFFRKVELRPIRAN